MNKIPETRVFCKPLYQIFVNEYKNCGQVVRRTYTACSTVNLWKGAERDTREEAEADGQLHQAALRELFGGTTL